MVRKGREQGAIVSVPPSLYHFVVVAMQEIGHTQLTGNQFKRKYFSHKV